MISSKATSKCVIYSSFLARKWPHSLLLGSALQALYYFCATAPSFRLTSINSITLYPIHIYTEGLIYNTINLARCKLSQYYFQNRNTFNRIVTALLWMIFPLHFICLNRWHSKYHSNLTNFNKCKDFKYFLIDLYVDFKSSRYKPNSSLWKLYSFYCYSNYLTFNVIQFL